MTGQAPDVLGIRRPDNRAQRCSHHDECCVDDVCVASLAAQRPCELTRFQGDRAALDTLWTVLESVCRAAAPLLPLTTEAIWRGLTGAESVHPLWTSSATR